VNLDVLDPDEATTLLARVAGDKRVSADSWATASLIGQCGRLPLALRVVGAKLAAKPHWSVQKLVKLLEDERTRLDRFTHGHLDVRASIALSYAGLGIPAQRLLCQLGDIDVSEVSVWLAAALIDDEIDVAEELLEELFDARLIDIAGMGMADRPYYRLHDLVRLYAKEAAYKRWRPDDLASSRARAFTAYLCVGELAYKAIFGGDFLTIHTAEPRWTVAKDVADAVHADPLGWFESERANIITVIQRAGDDGLAGACWDLTCTLSPLFPMRGYLDDWESVLAVGFKAATDGGDERGRAAILYRKGTLHADLQQPDDARRCFDESAKIFESVGDSHGHAIATAYIAMIDRFQNELGSALTRYMTALEGLREVDDGGGQGFVLRGIGQVYLSMGDLDDADEYFAHALDCYRALGGARIGEAQALFWQGMLRVRQGRFDEANPIFREVFEVSQVLGDRPGQAQALRGLGLCYQKQGDRGRARETLLEALRVLRQPRPDLVEAHIRQTIAELDASEAATNA
jgi:tetratricopeptide (TPR) repeat protein